MSTTIKKTSRENTSKDGSNESLPIFELQLDETWQNSDGFCRRTTFGKKNTKPNKTIMMIGATGAGKTTLINSMINYILGVKWEDDFRFVLIDEGKQKSQAESQTSQITAYQINHMEGFQVPYTLTIVDTPGFGDTRGISHDQKITKQIQDFFSARGGIDRIDAVCFVMQASLARLTHTQRYIFDSILSIFGKDIAENILMMVTFADGKKPPVLEAIKVSQVPCSTNESGEPLHFKFNNSALFATNNKTAEGEESDFENFDQMFWKLGFYSMKKFFASLNKMETKSLSLTQEVLKERQHLEVHVEGLQPQINAGLSKLDEIKKTRAALEQHKAEMDANKDFEYVLEVTVPKMIENEPGNFLTNCQICHNTCHDGCAYSDDKDKDKCYVMKNGKCSVCPGKCAWNVHFNQKYKWNYVTEKRKQTYKDLKKRFEAAYGKVTSKEKIFEELENELEVVQNIVTSLIEKSQRSLERLQEIALKPNPLSTPDYIDLMIESEKQEAKPGFQNRIQSLMEVRKKAEIISKVSTGEVLPEEWNAYTSQKDKKKGSHDGGQGSGSPQFEEEVEFAVSIYK
uniref:Septin-type G domain-containing protein n=1 Tax=Cyprinus carpio TaxID=7962 RepID=A0A8C1LHL1_CYPCA